MKKTNHQKEHPEIDNIKNVCEVSPDIKSTEAVCDKVNKPNTPDSKQKKLKP